MGRPALTLSEPVCAPGADPIELPAGNFARHRVSLYGTNNSNAFSIKKRADKDGHVHCPCLAAAAKKIYD